uniref:Tripartite motif-containing protein 16-like n=1 Tax=Poecilia mexicana TaxID=48701 RepID=A0A3B3YV42_9TELE
MAQKAVQLDRESFSCSVCLDLLKDPVMIPCGHSYCLKCIKNFWDEKNKKGDYSCPQCRQTFTPRPSLVKNIMLAGLTEQLKLTGLGASFTEQSYAGPEDHLQPHYDVAQLKKHQLVQPSKQLHDSHDVVSKDLEVKRGEIQQTIQDGERDMKLLQQEVDAIKVSADKAVKENEKVFTELICLVQKRSSELKQQIRSQQESEVNRVRDLQEKLEQEITVLKRKDAELKQLSCTEDHNQFLQKYPSLSAVSETKHSSSINVRPLRYFEDVTAAVSKLRDELQDILKEKWTNISLKVPEVDVLLSEPEPRTRDDFLRYSQEITLDPNTAQMNLLLSEGNRKVTLMNQSQFYPDHPERLSGTFQVLSKQSLSRRCYWEVQWGGRGGRGSYVAVAYKDVYKTNSVFGQNDTSWSLFCCPNNHQFWYNNIQTPIPGSEFSRVGVYLDQPAGTLSFYNVSESMILIHRVQTSFTQPLYAGIQLYSWYGDTAEICKLK